MNELQRKINRIKRRIYTQKKYLPFFMLERSLNILYERKFGRKCDFKNPKCFTEKLQWYQIYFDHPDFDRICDKIKFKEYVAEKIGDGYTARLYGEWDNINDIDIDNLPNTFVLKSNCSLCSKNIIIVKDKSKFDIEKARKQIKKWLKPKNTMVGRYGRCYWRVKPKIMAEEYIKSIDNMPVDYKISCFSGKPYCTVVMTERFLDDKLIKPALAFYDIDWNLMPISKADHNPYNAEKPKHYNEMIKFAEILSSDFPYARIDFYDTDEQIYIGEITFYPAGGRVKYNPDSFDYEIGDKFILPKKNTKKRLKAISHN